MRPCDEQWLWWTYCLGKVRASDILCWDTETGARPYVKAHNLSRCREGSRPAIRGEYFYNKKVIRLVPGSAIPLFQLVTQRYLETMKYSSLSSKARGLVTCILSAFPRMKITGNDTLHTSPRADHFQKVKNKLDTVKYPPLQDTRTLPCGTAREKRMLLIGCCSCLMLYFGSIWSLLW